MHRILVAAALLLFWPTAHAGDEWASISGASVDITGTGDEASPDGASVRLASNAPGSALQGAIKRIDAAPFRGRRVTLSATLAGAGSALWLRADRNGKPVAFQNSAQRKVRADHPTYRQVTIYVPSDADQLAYGFIHGTTPVVDASGVMLRASRVEHGPRAVLQDALAKIESNALRAGNVQWTDLAAELELDAHSEDPASAYPAIRRALAALDDNHSFLVPFDGARESSAQGLATVPPGGELVAPGIGYVSVPGYVGSNPADDAAFSGTLDALVAALARDGARSWIVDLRGNRGGNMWPMLAGLRSFLGDGVVGYSEDASGRRAWRPGGHVEGGSAPGVDLRSAPVAVLLGPRTSSSGEAVALAFRGRERTRAFGRPTDGRATSNRAIPLLDGSLVALTTALMLDRNGAGDGAPIRPDVEVQDCATDCTRDMAIAWLLDAAPGSVR